MKKFVNKKKGQVMLITTIFFMSFSLIVSTGLVLPIINQLKVSSNLWKSTESYYTAEAGVEDVTYRIKSGKPYTARTPLIIDGLSSEVNLVESFEGITITSTGVSGNHEKQVETKVVKGDGVSFAYGMQIGTGGISLFNNSSIKGNVYSGGDMYGSGGTAITGSAFVSNSPSLIVDQENSLPSSPTNSIVFGSTDATQDFSQSFKVSTTSIVTQINLLLSKTGLPSDATIKIVKDASGSPSSNPSDLLSSGTLYSSLVTNNFGWIELPLAQTPTLTKDVLYWLVIDASTGSQNKSFTIGSNLDSNYLRGLSKTGRLGSTWGSPTGYDSYFKIFLGGKYSKITGESPSKKFDIGTVGVGNAQAHTVNNVSVSGYLRCQSGTGNNKGCDTAYPDPAPVSYPISTGNITEWKETAVLGGVINGDYELQGVGTTNFGPKKITGNLSVTGGHTLNLVGTVWVTGNIVVGGGSNIKLDSTYGTNSGVIISDGVVSLSGSGVIEGSGGDNSFVLLVTTSNCPNDPSCDGEDAVDMSGSGGAVIINAQNGSVSFSSSAKANSVVANEIKLNNSASIIYKDGLINQNFVGGPTGGFNISSWREIE